MKIRQRCQIGEVVELLQIGRRFSRLVVLHNVRKYKPYQYRVRVKCDCGRIKIVCRYDLLNGDTTSCSCYQRRDLAIRNRGNAHGVTHGATKADASPALKRTYNSWKAMIQRTTNPKANAGKDWHLYGGRGIRVCPNWLHSFASFLADMGERM